MWVPLVVACLIAAAAAGGGVYWFTRPSGSTPVAHTAAGVTSSATQSGSSAGSDDAGQPPRNLLPDVSREQMRQHIQSLLYRFHEDVVDGDYHSAWELMSARKKSQELRKDGYNVWRHHQQTLTPYLDPSGITVSIDDLDPSTGVARVTVTGMTWSAPHASCANWSGVTWAKYENGAWRYDPGYSTTPQRKREWKPRFAELLGGSC
jgi:hypothetical protein